MLVVRFTNNLCLEKHVSNKYLIYIYIYIYRSATVFLGNWEVTKDFLISSVNFYYVINKLIILVSDPH
jgi:hypothetical protein